MAAIDRVLLEQTLGKLTTFLHKYLPLANAHVADFLIEDYWNRFVPETICRDLLELSEVDLAHLPSCALYEGLVVPNDGMRATGSIGECHIQTSANAMEYNGGLGALCADQSAGERTVWDRSRLPQWDCKDLKTFTLEAQRLTLPYLGVLTNIGELMRKWQQKEASQMVIHQFMSEKKSHEVQVMAEVCSVLASSQDIDTVIDIGSGRGYLSSHLCLMHGLSVLAVDSSTINTKSAQTRNQRLEKHWGGLIRNAKKATTDSSASAQVPPLTQVTSNNRPTGDEIVAESPRGEGKMRKRVNCVQITQFVTPATDLQMLVRKHLACHEETTISQAVVESAISETSDFVTSCSTAHATEGVTSNPIASVAKGVMSHPIASVGEEVTSHPVESVMEGVMSDPIDSVSKRVMSHPIDAVTEGVISLNSVTEDMTSNHIDSVMSDSIDAVTEGVMSCDSVADDITSHHVNSMTSHLIDPVTEGVMSLGSVAQDLMSHPVDPPQRTSVRVLLTGLHTCGNLSASMLEVFSTSEAAGAVCNVGCCYHHLDEAFTRSPFEGDGSPVHMGFPMSGMLRSQGFQLGRNARMLASQTPARMASVGKVSHRSLFYRALLQMMLRDLTGHVSDDWHVGKIFAKSKDFPDYVQRALRKLQLDDHGKMTHDKVREHEVRHAMQESRLTAFVQLRATLAPVIEATILLDRLLYLHEQEHVSECHLVQLFDRVMSPRCYGILAVRR